MSPAGHADIVEKLRLELRRGALPLAVLAQLRREHYGYSLRKELNGQGLDIDEGTLYPLVRRLEKQGLLSSEWRQDDARQKRYYRLSPLGEQVLKLLVGEWQVLNASVERIVEEN
jgi:PadR family transcriptional regulator PadR